MGDTWIFLQRGNRIDFVGGWVEDGDENRRDMVRGEGWRENGSGIISGRCRNLA